MPGEAIAEIAPTITDHVPQKLETVTNTVPTQPPLEGNTLHEGEKPVNPFDSMRETVTGLVDQIRSGRNVEQSKFALSNLLRAREKYYRDIALALNPDIQPVEGKEHLYRIGDTEIYGSITAMLDATPALAEHKKFAQQVSLQMDAETVMGEQLSPRSLLESTMVYAGSNAQDRIQPFAADIDMDEYIKITAPDRKTAIGALASALQRSARRPIVAETPNGEKVDVHLTHVTLGRHREGPQAGKPMLWTASDLNQGYKELVDARGNTYHFALAEACANPFGLSADYLGLTDNTVFGINKTIDVLAVDNNGNTLVNTVGRSAKAMQQVYFDDPSSFRLLEQTYDANSFVKYVTAMENEVLEKSDVGHINKMKMMKRLYNLFKAQGDIANISSLSTFFSSPTSAVYQLESRYKLAREAVTRGIMTGQQRDAIKTDLFDALSRSDNPLAGEAKTLLESQHIHLLYGKFHATIKELINAEVDQFLQQTPDVQHAISKIRQPKQP